MASGEPEPDVRAEKWRAAQDLHPWRRGSRRGRGGIDPHLSPAAVRIQIARVARARGLQVDEVERLVAEHTAAPQFGLLGAPRVNVLELNLALDGAGKPE